MNLTQLIKQAEKERYLTHGYGHSMYHHKDISPLNNLESSLGVFDNKQNNFGNDYPVFYSLLISLFDRAIVDNDLHELSMEQQKLLEQYLLEGNILTRKHTSATNQSYISDEDMFLDDIWILVDNNYELKYNGEYQDMFNNLDRVIKNLDEFLGSYFGENDGRYSRYPKFKKQFHSEYKLTGTKVRNTTRD